MKRRKISLFLCLGLGVLIGVAIAASPNDWPSRQAHATTGTIQDDKSGQNDKTQVKNASPQEAAPFQGVIAPTVRESVPHWPEQKRAPNGAPNVLFVMIDDLGFSQLGCYGAQGLRTPNIDKLAAGGLRYNNFHATPLCSPSRAALLTGRNHHCYTHNYVGLREYSLESSIEVPSGETTLKYEFEVTGPPDFAVGKGAAGIGRLFIGGEKVAEDKIPVTTPITFALSGEGLCCGWDSLSPASSAYSDDFRFTGKIKKVDVACAKAASNQPPAKPSD